MNKWLSLPELMQRRQTDLIENVFEAIRAGLPVYEYIDVGGTPDALELRPKDFMDRFQAVPPAWEKPAWATGIKPLRSGDVRFLVDDVEAFEQAHRGARQEGELPPLDPGRAIVGWKLIADAVGKSSDYAKEYCRKNGIRIQHDKANKPWTTPEEIARCRATE